MNSLCDLKSAQSYLNVCSGSATLLIEAARTNPELKLVGFDINGTTNAMAVKNIKKAGFIKSIQLKTADMFDKPDLGTFDIIASDLPFGMAIGKDQDLEKLYSAFIEYCERTLNPGGTLIIYTSEHKTLQPIIENSKFSITKTLDLKFLSSVDAYLKPKVFLCEFK